eukprot:4991366-Prorocentrum_lima.AAC.1
MPLMPAPKSVDGVVVGTGCCTQLSGSTSGRTSSMWQGGCDGAGTLANHMCTRATGILLQPS